MATRVRPPKQEKVEVEEQVFDTSTLKGLSQAERYKAKLNDKYVRVAVIPVGLNRVRIVGAVRL